MPRILIVEDEPVIAGLLRDDLLLQGYRLDLLRDHRPARAWGAHGVRVRFV